MNHPTPEDDLPQDPKTSPQSDAAPAPQATPAGADDDRFGDVLSGRFDVEADESPEPEAAAAPPKRVLQPQQDSPKLHKVLAQAGLGSRLEMEQMIEEGRISVNNEPAHVGQRIQYGDQIKVNGKAVRIRIDPPAARVIAYHKPAGEVVTHDDPQNRPTVFRRLPRLHAGKWQSVGRLDLNTEGLLLLTNSGELANRLMHPRFGLEREYAVRVLGALNKEEKQKLLDGVRLDDGMAQFGSIEDGGGEGANTWYRVTISEGRNREVRRMLEAVGHAVSRLIRIRYGAMLLPRGLKRGAFMELDERDINSLMEAAGVPKPARGEKPLVRAPGKHREGGGAQVPAAPSRIFGAFGKGGGEGGAPANTARPAGPRGGYKNAARVEAARGEKAEGQPDPLKTSLGYIGADSLKRQRQETRKTKPPGGPRGRGR
ncbi:pseudouridine synthase [Xylophilus rhododendri]|uniref:pseudouridine synthase n=1 Tax=Xylophilus rhododendri TaxID=2697032 RepID=UPI0018A281A7|nr:pseudouridine synthase [Xylophilus rhododendri]